MGLIREPDEVDFLVKSRPLTEKERKEINEFIENAKQKRKLVHKRIRTHKKAKKSA